MGVKVKTKGSETSAEVLARYKKKMGDDIGEYGGNPTTSDRIPTGLFEFDLASGGGIPRGRCTIVYGPEDSAKTTVAFLLIANHQRLWPDLTCTYVAIEPFDGPWAAKCGVDISKLVVLYPAYAEEAVDMAEDMLIAEDCGLVVVDSLAAMITTQEAGKSAEGATPGGSGLVTGKMVRKTTLSLREAEKAGRSPTLVYINQIRHKIGVMFGSPETMPGGFAPLYQARMRVRLYGKGVKDEKISSTLNVRREITFSLKKTKIPIVSVDGKTEVVVYPHNNLRIGDSNDINTIMSYLKDFDACKDLKTKGWEILGDTYPTQAAFKDRVYMDRAFGSEVKKAIIERVLSELDYDLTYDEQTVDADGVITGSGE